MATYFVYFGGNGLAGTTDPATSGDWSGAYPLLADAAAVMVAGDTVKISDQHTETTASIPPAMPGTLGSPNKILVVQHSDTSTLSTGLLMNYTAANNGNPMTGSFFVYGMHIKNGRDVTIVQTSHRKHYKNCKIETLSNRYLYMPGVSNGVTILEDTQVIGNSTVLVNCTYPGGTLILDNTTSTTGGKVRMGQGQVFVYNSDLSNGLDYISTSTESGRLYMERCKVLPGIFSALSTIAPSGEVDAYSCDTGDGYFTEYHQDYYGTDQTDTTQYLAATYDGSNGVSLVIDSSSNAIAGINYHKAKLVTLPIQNLTSDKVYKINLESADATLTNRDVHVEAVYNTAGSLAFGTSIGTGITNPEDVGTPLTTNTESWSVSGGTSYEISVTIPAQQGVTNGVVTLYVALSKPNTTVNVDYKVV